MAQGSGNGPDTSFGEYGLDEPVQVVGADGRWPGWFEAERARIRTAVREPVRVEHVGSTAVPGLDAKPIVDILVGVPPGTDLAAVAGALLPLGYECLGDAGVPGRLYLRRRGVRSFNVSVTALDGELWENNLLLRDFLRADPEARRTYARAKRAAVAAGRRGLLAYSEAKSWTVEALLAEARARRDRSSG